MRRQVLTLLVILAFCAFFQAWFLGLTPHGVKFGDAKLSNAYTEALAHGQSYLLTAPDPRLVAAKDPFGPATAALMISDTSYYRGHYYLYFGIMPFVTFMVPWRLLTGEIPSPELGLFVFGLIGYTAYGAILLLIVRKFFAAATPLICGLAYLTILVGGLTWPLMGRPAVYELENAAAYAFLALSLLGLARYEWSEKRSVWNLCAAMAFAAGTIGCRPNYAPAVTVLAFWTVYRLLTTVTGSRKRTICLLTAMWPLFFIGFLLAAWNVYRFGHPTDFGLKHTVSEDPRLVRPLVSVSNLPYHLHRYLLGLPRLVRYFPFIQGQREGPFKILPGHEASNQVYGILIIVPIVLLGILRLVSTPLVSDLKRFSLFCCIIFLVNFALLSAITISCYRYPVDFMGPLALSTSIGITSYCSIRGTMRYLASIAFCLLVSAWSTVSCIAYSYSVAQNTSLYDIRRPEAFERAAIVFNQPTFILESLTKDRPGALALLVRLPSDRAGKSEPILTTGEIGAQDFLYFYYSGPQTLQVGFESMGLGGFLSKPITLDYSQAHQVVIALGSLLPAKGDFIYSGMSENESKNARSRLLVRIDGIVAIDSKAQFHPVRAQIFVGSSPFDAAFGNSFSGKLLSAIRVDPAPLLLR